MMRRTQLFYSLHVLYCPFDDVINFIDVAICLWNERIWISASLFLYYHSKEGKWVQMKMITDYN